MPARIFGRKRCTHSTFKIQYDIIMVSQSDRKNNKGKRHFEFKLYLSVLRETCTFIEKYLYGFKLKVVLDISS